MKKWIKIALAGAAAVILCITLSGCRKIEVAERAFVEALGLDRNGGELTVTLQLQSSDENGTEPYILTGKGESFTEAFSSAENGQTKKLFLGHCKVIILGEGVSDVRSELEYFLNSNRISPGVKLAFAEGKALDLFTGADFQRLLKQSAERGETVDTDLVRFFEQCGGTLLPIISKEGNEIAVKNCGLVTGGIRGGNFSAEEAKGAALLAGKIESMPIGLAGGGAVSVTGIAVDFAPEKSADGVMLRVEMKADVKAEEGLYGVPEEEIKPAVGNELKRLSAAALKKSSETGTDFLLLEWKMKSASPISEREFRRFLENMRFDITVESNIEPQRKF